MAAGGMSRPALWSTGQRTGPPMTQRLGAGARRPCGSIFPWSEQRHLSASEAESLTIARRPFRMCLTMKVLLGRALRETTGFVESPPRLVSPDSGARRQRAVASPEDAAGEHPLSRLGRSASPVDRQHRDQGRGRRRVERPRARRSQTPGLGAGSTWASTGQPWD